MDRARSALAAAGPGGRGSRLVPLAMCRLSALCCRGTRLPRPTAIGVFGAAEYDGRPSPVYRARLDHARALFHRGIAPPHHHLGGKRRRPSTPKAPWAASPRWAGHPGRSHHRRDREPQHRGVGPPHCPSLRRANGLRRLVIVSDGTTCQNSRNLRRRRARLC